jgi:hypothetical protein
VSELSNTTSEVFSSLSSFVKSNDPQSRPVKIVAASDTKIRGIPDISSSLLYGRGDIEQNNAMNTTGGNELAFNDPPSPWRLSLADDTSQLLSFFGLLISKDNQAFIVPANNLVQRLISYSRGIYDNALMKCRGLLASLDFSDEESKVTTRERLQDVFDIFSEFSEPLFQHLSLEYRDNPSVIGFLLAEVLVDVPVESNAKISIISSYATNPRAGIRYEAVRALDMLNSSAAQNALQLLREREGNSEVRSLIEASLRRQN